MSHTAIAAALALPCDLSSGERLAAFSLASFADREGRCWPGTPAAAARAGLARSAVLQARNRLSQRGLVVVEVAATGRGRASVLALPFAVEGPWWDGEINAELFESVLGYSKAHGSARLLLAALAALAYMDGIVDGLTTEQLRAAAGISDRTYRRVRGALVASGEVAVDNSCGGRGQLNRWVVTDPRARGLAGAGAVTPRRVPPPAGARPLVAAAAPQNRPAMSGVESGNPCQDQTVPAEKRPPLSGDSTRKPCQAQTLWPQSQAETPAQTPAPHVRAGREPQNPRTTADPPTPLAGGLHPDSIVVEETYVTDRGRERRRQVVVDLAAIRERLVAGNEADRSAWSETRAFLLDAVGESQFEIWLAPLELIAIDGETLIVAAPAATASWVRSRFGRLLDAAAQRAGRALRIADEVERAAAAQLCDGTPPLCDGSPTVRHQNRQITPDQSLPDLMIDAMADPSAYTQVHNQQREVS